MKHKTKSAVKKRIKRTGSGKLMMKAAATNHLLSSKSTKTRRNKSNGLMVSKGHAKMLQSVIA